MRYLLLFFLSFPAYAAVLEFKNVLFNDGTSVTGHITLGEPIAPGSQPGVLDFVIQTQEGELPALTYSKAAGNSSEKGTRTGLLFASPFEADPSRRLFVLSWGSFLPPPFPIGVCQAGQSTDCLSIEESITVHFTPIFSRETISGSLGVVEVPEPSAVALLGAGLLLMVGTLKLTR